MDMVDWSFLPDHVLVNIFSYLKLCDRFSVSYICKSWNVAFYSPHLWKQVNFRFVEDEDEQQLELFNRIGRYIQSLEISVDQESESCRECSCHLILQLAEIPMRQLRNFKIVFVGQNPMLYSGQEFIDRLTLLFGPHNKADDVSFKSLKQVDLRGLLVSFSGQLLEILADNNPELEVLNIQNNALVCKVQPNSLLYLVKHCRKLWELRVFSCSCTEDVLLAFCENDRVPLKRLSIFCRREEKYVRDIPSSVWMKLVTKLPELRVTLGFDHTCPLLKIAEVMKPEIPVSELRLETATDLWNEVNLARSFYKNTLEKLIVKSPPSKARELDSALLDVAKNCPKLRSLHVLYVLDKDIVEKILELCPFMRENKTYTLKFVAEPHPWKPGDDFW